MGKTVRLPVTDDSMNRRRRTGLAVLVTFIAILVLGFGGWLAFSPGPILPGMALPEIEARLGPADGNMIAVGNKPVTATTLVWKDRGLVVEFDGDGRARTVSSPPTLLDKLRSMLGL